MSYSIILGGLLVRLAVAFWNGYFGPSFGADGDALNFHNQAVYHAENLASSDLSIGWIYAYVLGLAYRYTVSSLFLGSFLSCLAWLASALVFAWVLTLLEVPARKQWLALLVYSLLPSSIIYTSITLREPYQLLFVNLATYAALSIYLGRSSIYWAVMVVAVTGMGVLHGALLIFGVIFVAGTMFVSSLRGQRLVTPRLVVITVLVFAVSTAGLLVFASYAYTINEGLVAAVDAYQQGALGIDARANYRSLLSLSGPVDLTLFVPTAVLQYLFEPFPWRELGLIDILILAENALRAWLIWMAIRGLQRVPSRGRRAAFLVFAMYAACETIWSLGTSNWGTALRHHLPAMGLLLAAAFAYAPLKARVNLMSLQ